MKYPRKATVFWPAHHRNYKVLNMENIVGHYTAYSVEKKCLLCTFWGEEGAVNEYLECSWISMSLMVGTVPKLISVSFLVECGMYGLT